MIIWKVRSEIMEQMAFYFILFFFFRPCFLSTYISFFSKYTHYDH